MGDQVLHELSYLDDDRGAITNRYAAIPPASRTSAAPPPTS